MRFLQFEELYPERGIKLSKVSIWRLEKVGRFPKHVIVGNRKAWAEDEIDAYQRDLLAARDNVIAALDDKRKAAAAEVEDAEAEAAEAEDADAEAADAQKIIAGEADDEAAADQQAA